MKNVTINCASGEERKVLAYIEKKYPNVEWRSGKRPTDVPDHYFYDNGTLINVCQNKISCISATEPNFYGDPVVTAEKFLKKVSKPSTVIFRRGRNVIAKNVVTGDEGIAKCSPNDEFCFKTGASIALARLMAKTPEALNHDVKDEWIKVLGLTPVDDGKPTPKFNVGDYVTLKEGLAVGKNYGGLELLQGAMHDNAHNKRMTVVHVDWSDDSGTYYCECKGDSQFTFHYSEQMLDKWDESKIHEGDTVKVVNTGLNYSSYVQWVGEHISDPYMAARFCFGSPNTDRKYKVIKIAEHESNGRTLAFIEECDGFVHNRCYLIEVKGLVKA